MCKVRWEFYTVKTFNSAEILAINDGVHLEADMHHTFLWVSRKKGLVRQKI